MHLFLIALLFTTPQEYFQLGITRHDAGDYAAARDALEKARELKHPAPIQLPLRLARTYSRLGEREKALEYLKTASSTPRTTSSRCARTSAGRSSSPPRAAISIPAATHPSTARSISGSANGTSRRTGSGSRAAASSSSSTNA